MKKSGIKNLTSILGFAFALLIGISGSLHAQNETKTTSLTSKRKGRFFIPRGNTELLVGDRILVITDDEKALEETYQSMKGKAQEVKPK